MNSQWEQFIKLFSEKNPDLTYSQVIKKAKKPFEKIQQYYMKGGWISTDAAAAHLKKREMHIEKDQTKIELDKNIDKALQLVKQAEKDARKVNERYIKIGRKGIIEFTLSVTNEDIVKTGAMEKLINAYKALLEWGSSSSLIATFTFMSTARLRLDMLYMEYEKLLKDIEAKMRAEEEGLVSFAFGFGSDNIYLKFISKISDVKNAVHFKERLETEKPYSIGFVADNYKLEDYTVDEIRKLTISLLNLNRKWQNIDIIRY